MSYTARRNTLTSLIALAVICSALIIASGLAVLAHSAEGTTTLSFSSNPATLVTGPDVTITTRTLSDEHPEKVDDGKIQISIATDGAGNPVGCSEVVSWVRIDAAILGGGGGLPLTGGETTLSVDLDNLSSLGLDLNNVACGDVVCFRAHYVTGGGRDKVETHFSETATLMTACHSEGCSPGYWKNHTNSWAPAGYSPSELVGSVFSEADAFPTLAAATLHQALNFGGGPEAEGAARILLRAAVAALLNASHPGVGYPETAASVIAAVDAALASGNRDTMLTLADTLDFENNLGCPLN
ncbi:MAG TPA: hypothetical protein PLP42_05600 [Acidobacteriota bacterium]|nr:hypothetical protein [Acidobacteriota bacterium]